MRQPDPRGRKGQAGFTILELVLMVLVFGLVVIKASEVFGVSSDAQNTLSVHDLLEERVRATTERITNRLRQAGRSTVQDVPDAPGTSASIRFRRLEGYDLTQGPQWGVEESIALVNLEQGEGPGTVMWNPGTGGEVWASDVNALRFSRDGRRIRFEIEVIAQGTDGDRITVRRIADVTLQN